MAKELIEVGGGIPFNPTAITIKKGDTICWKWFSGIHTVTADDGSFDSGIKKMDITNAVTFEHVFNTVGTFPYYCKLHGKPGGIGMSGTVIVT